MKVETAGTGDVAVTGGSAHGVLVRGSWAAPGAITQDLHRCAQQQAQGEGLRGELWSREG